MKLLALDIHFSLLIRMRDHFQCQRCGAVYPNNARGLDCSHFVGRANKRLRYDERNCDALCRGCHAFFETHKGTLYRAWKIERLGQDVFDAMEIESRIPLKSSEMKAVADRIRQRAKEVRSTLQIP